MNEVYEVTSSRDKMLAILPVYVPVHANRNFHSF